MFWVGKISQDTRSGEKKFSWPGLAFMETKLRTWFLFPALHPHIDSGEIGPLCPVAGNIYPEVELPCNIRILLQDIYSQNLKTESQRDICRSMFMTTLLTMAEMWEKPKCPLIDA